MRLPIWDSLIFFVIETCEKCNLLKPYPQNCLIYKWKSFEYYLYLENLFTLSCQSICVFNILTFN
jgi:hypothetical protein